MSTTKVIYRDITEGAAEDATVTVVGAEPVSNVAALPFGRTTTEPLYATAEPNRWILDGSAEIMDEAQPVFWSKAVSGVCDFDEPPTMTFSFSELFSGSGLTITFGQGEWCSEIEVFWLAAMEILDTQTFCPTSSLFTCNYAVVGFDQIVVKLNKTAMPYRRARVDQVQFGLIRKFDMSEIRKGTVTAEMSLSGLELPESSLSVTLESKDDIEYIFQTKQKIQIEHGGDVIGTFFLKKANRYANRMYAITCQDVIGTFNDVQFPGGAYLSGVSASALLISIVDNATRVIIDCEDATLYGVLKPMKKKEAIQQLLFAWGASAQVTAIGELRVYDPTDDVHLQSIPDDRVYQGGKTETATAVTAVNLTCHTFTRADNGFYEINGVRYDDTRSVVSIVNPNIKSGDKSNVVSVENATLISSVNVQQIAQRLYNYYTRCVTYNGSIVWDGETIGDCLSVKYPWGDTHTGNVERIVLTLSNTIKANCKILTQEVSS